jgi:hypothetical protein
VLTEADINIITRAKKAAEKAEKVIATEGGGSKKRSSKKRTSKKRSSKKHTSKKRKSKKHRSKKHKTH